MSDQKVDDGFEQAFVAKYQFGALAASANSDAYAMYHAAKWAWEASRAALVIELPEAPAAPRNSSSYREGLADGVERGIEKCRDAVEAAGIKVKP